MKSILFLGFRGEKEANEGAWFEAFCTDVMMLFCWEKDRAILFSIPRDIWVDKYEMRLNRIYDVTRDKNKVSAIIENMVGVKADYVFTCDLELFEKALKFLGKFSIRGKEEEGDAIINYIKERKMGDMERIKKHQDFFLMLWDKVFSSKKVELLMKFSPLLKILPGDLAKNSQTWYDELSKIPKNNILFEIVHWNLFGMQPRNQPALRSRFGGNTSLYTFQPWAGVNDFKEVRKTMQDFLKNWVSRKPGRAKRIGGKKR